MNIFTIAPWQSEELSYFDTKSWIWWDTGSFHLFEHSRGIFSLLLKEVFLLDTIILT